MFARVNGKTILKDTINYKYSIQCEQMNDNGLDHDFDEDEQNTKIEIANEIIDKLLLVQYGREQNLCPDEEELRMGISAAMDKISQSEQDQTPSVQLRTDVYEELVIGKIKKKLYRECLPNNVEVLKKFYEENKRHFSQGPAVEVRHIFFQFDNDHKNLNNKAHLVLKHLQDGKDFSKLAKDFSDCPSKSRGGDLGFITEGSTDEDFEKAVFALEVNKLSDIVESEHGLHIVEVSSKIEKYSPPFDSLKDKLNNFLTDLSCEESLDQLVFELRENAHIEYLGV